MTMHKNLEDLFAQILTECKKIDSFWKNYNNSINIFLVLNKRISSLNETAAFVPTQLSGDQAYDLPSIKESLINYRELVKSTNEKLLKNKHLFINGKIPVITNVLSSEEITGKINKKTQIINNKVLSQNKFGMYYSHSARIAPEAVFGIENNQIKS